ncbi:alpha/beta fold hydrolase [Pontibacter burrus]|uniref:Alpha/beta hydrolase n=1 Tax=Pontibacter burrus TaxID=2704466 RepID=A0A6B3LIK7_9BACT|nr:alpha/beta hydrolase [Pontibacter burrus]NEM96479.1 alpha/beta hydrolase [Pontibacter burrus]
MKKKFRNIILLSGFGLLLCLHAQCQAPAAVSATTKTDAVFENLNYRYPAKKVKLANGTTIAYTDQGKGTETLILIHGLGSYLPAWNKNIEDLSKNYRTIALDLPGYGKSSKEDVQPGMANYAQTVLALMDKLKIKKAILVGHSMGGQIAITAALQAPERVNKLVLAAPAGLETFTEQQKQLFKMTVTPESVQNTPADKAAANIKINFYQMPADAQFMIDDRLKMAESADFGNYSKAVAASVAAMVDEPVYDKLPQLQVPTLIIFGEQDTLIPNKYLNPNLTTQAVANIGKEKIKNSQVILLPEAGHFVQFEQAAAFNKAVRDFIK